MIFAGALRGAGDTRVPMVITAGAIWLIRLPLAYVLGVMLGWGWWAPGRPCRWT